jgi:glyoxylase-like metal-dependent hydrolase (beta-lactamase superfamily II)
VQALDGVPPEIVMVPLPGHTHGHAGIAVDRGDRWLLNAGDAYFYHREMDPEAPWCTPGLRAYQWMMEQDRAARLANQRRLRALRRDHAGEVDIFCGHDPVEFERLAGRTLSLPPHALVEQPLFRQPPLTSAGPLRLAPS